MVSERKGTFIMVDGIDGSGKGTIASAFSDHLSKQGKIVFDLREYWKTHNQIPELDDIECDVIISAEPTRALVGKVICDEIKLKNGRNYSGVSIAHAFSLDREILYRKLLIPALAAGKIIIQERGVVSSIVYQPIQEDALSLEEVTQLPGNALTLEHAPTLLLITTINPEVSMQRLKDRIKQDNDIFEKIEFQKKVDARYRSEWLKKLFEEKGSNVEYLDTSNDSVEETCFKAIALAQKYLQ